MKLRYLGTLLSVVPLFAGLPACSDDTTSTPDDNGGEGGSGNSGNTAGMSNMGGTGGGDVEPTIVEISESITEDTDWTADNIYILTGLTYVEGNSVLTIEPGTEVRGDSGSALVITRGSQVNAEGTAADPIVFTSSADVGSRAPGDWGGVVLLGDAPINTVTGTNLVEGIDPAEPRVEYGGDDEGSSCGTISYARIEFAGFEFTMDNELNGLTIGGCGSGTTLDYIHVHKGLDDGVEFFGGTADLKHVIMTAGDDDGLDWDFGWSGRAQFIVVQHPDDTAAENGIEADNQPAPGPYTAEPRAMPTIYNVTFVGGNSAVVTQRGMLLRRGTWGIIRNAIITDFGTAAIDVRDAETAAGTEEAPVALTVENSCFFNIGPGGETYFDDESVEADDDDGGFDEEAFFTDGARNNLFGEDPDLDENFVPGSARVTESPADPPNDGFFDNVTYIGALEPGETPWTDGWTDFPED